MEALCNTILGFLAVVAGMLTGRALFHLAIKKSVDEILERERSDKG